MDEAWVIKFQKENIKYSLAEEFKSKEEAENFISKIVIDSEFYTPTKI